MIVLASGSASRRAMLAAAGVEFEAVRPDVDERALEAEFAGGRPDQVALALAEAKALAVATSLTEAAGEGGGEGRGEIADRLVLGGDSLAVLGADRFDKPASREEATEHLRAFSGRILQLHSAAAIVKGNDIAWRHAGLATLQFRQLSDDFIAQYLDAEWPEVGDCVGVFRIEGRGVQLFERIDGDRFVVLGMPLIPVLGALREMGELPA